MSCVCPISVSIVGVVDGVVLSIDSTAVAADSTAVDTAAKK